jgi:hypothetical protein
VRNGFRIATADLNVLQRALRIETEANKGDFAWYPDMESMRYCIYVKPDVHHAQNSYAVSDASRAASHRYGGRPATAR